MSIPAKEVEAVKAYLRTNKDVLLSQNVERIIIGYDGSGDEGRVHDVHAEPNYSFAIDSELFEMFASLEPDDNYGDNEGGGGTITCNVVDQTIHHEAYDYVTETRYAPSEVL